jgi:redox-sensitive bicupin YhaK (pirin superfamily)
VQQAQINKESQMTTKYLPSGKMGRGHHGWLESHFHFSFANYQNPSNVHFGQLRVINDDIVKPGTGFDTHPHANMEIISYVLNGTLEHQDSIGNKEYVNRGQVQYMSAGTGIEHSEYNGGTDDLRFLQIWVFPREKGLKPNYGDKKLAFEARYNNWLQIVGDVETPKADIIGIYQDMNIYALYATDSKHFDFEVKQGRQAYLVLAEGNAVVNGQKMTARDAMEFVEENIKIDAQKDAHFVLLEMQKY